MRWKWLTISTSFWAKAGSNIGAPEDGRNYRPKHGELTEIVNKIIVTSS